MSKINYQALLDEREKNQQYIKRRDQENEMMVDAMHAAIALTSVGIDLDDYDECVLRLHEWGALPDYCIALYVDFVHGIVSKNKLLDFGYINGAPVWTLRDELEAAKSKLNEQREYYEGVISDGSKRIAELEACRAALAAENAGLKAICDDRRRLIMSGVQRGYIKVPTAETDPDLETIRIAISPQKPIPATDAFLAEIRAEARNEGINYTASRLAAAFNHGFINKSLREVFDVTRMILSAKEELANEPHPIDGLSGEYAEKSLEEWAEQIRKGADK